MALPFIPFIMSFVCFLARCVRTLINNNWLDRWVLPSTQCRILIFKPLCENIQKGAAICNITILCWELIFSVIWTTFPFLPWSSVGAEATVVAHISEMIRDESCMHSATLRFKNMYAYGQSARFIMHSSTLHVYPEGYELFKAHSSNIVLLLGIYIWEA